MANVAYDRRSPWDAWATEESEVTAHCWMRVLHGFKAVFEDPNLACAGFALVLALARGVACNVLV
jgi:hypothetical protein